MASGISLQDAQVSALAPLSSGNGAHLLSVTTASAATASLAVGTYAVRIAGATGLLYGKLGGAAVLPTTGGAEVANTFCLADGERLVVRAAATLNVIATTGTATLGLTRLVG